jgi:hypothetical protein
MTIAATGTANAGEVAGPPRDGFATGKWTPVYDYVANSICAFSGLNALHDDKDPAGASPPVQSYGMAVKAGMKAYAPSPGVACNGNSGWLVNPPPDEH